MAGELTSEQLQQLYVCSLLLGKKREQPIFSCKAHVFHIDPKTKRSWIPASSTAISVSFFFDSSRSLYRIISVEGTKAVINSTITPNMTFTKTSQKFGQWSDVRANTVYGLGFPSEAELNKFIEKFQEVKEATKSINPPSAQSTTPSKSNTMTTANGPAPTTIAPPTSASPVPPSSANASPVVSRAGGGGDGSSPGPYPAPLEELANPPDTVDGVTAQMNKLASVSHQRSQSLSGLQAPIESPKHAPKDKTNTLGGSMTSTGSVSSATSISGGPGSSATLPHPHAAAAAASAAAGAHLPPGCVEAQLKYENDRLKLALAQSSANAKKWEVELATLKNNNARLTSALQESTANVEEWKRQLQAYKEENARMKAKLVDVESGRGAADTSELRRDYATSKARLETVETELRHKEEEVRQLAAQVRDLIAVSERVKALEEENAQLTVSLSNTRTQLEATVAAHETQKRVLEAINAQLLERVRDLTNIHGELATALDT